MPRRESPFVASLQRTGHLGRLAILALAPCGCQHDVTGHLPSAELAESERAAPTNPGAPPDGAPTATTICPSDACAGPLTFDTADRTRQRLERRGTTLGKPRRRSLVRCGGDGPSEVHELDLRAFTNPVPILMDLKATFWGSLRIERGPVDDPFVVACSSDALSFVGSAMLSAVLEPAQYRLIVAGHAEGEAGDYALGVEWLAPESHCRAPPANDRCEQAAALAADVERQWVTGRTHCATDQAQPLWESGDFARRAGEVFYRLDLSSRTEPSRLHAVITTEPAQADVLVYVLREAAGTCAETLASSNAPSLPGHPAELWADLMPDHYLLAVERSGPLDRDFGLLVELASGCAAENDNCETALTLEPRLGTQRVTAWPTCGDDSLFTSCQRLRPSPDLFYRLDLRSFEAPVFVRAETVRRGQPVESLVLLGESAGTCAGELWCGDFALWLRPDVYYLALDTFRDQQGPVELSVTLSLDSPPVPRPCIDQALTECARQFDCCDGSGDHCALAFESCGLDVAALECLCATDPACCGAGTSYDCGEILVQCNTFCAGFDPVFVCPQ